MLVVVAPSAPFSQMFFQDFPKAIDASSRYAAPRLVVENALTMHLAKAMIDYSRRKLFPRCARLAVANFFGKDH